MPREKRSNLAQKLATVVLGAATLAIAYAGQLPALAYGSPPPPPVAPGGFQSVVTSRTVGPGGATIAVNIGPCKASLTVPSGTFTTQVQLTITAPSVAGIGNAGHPGYHALCGIGVGITVNGTIYTGTFGHRLTLGIAGFAIRPGDRVALWAPNSLDWIDAANGPMDYTRLYSGYSIYAATLNFGGHDFRVPAPEHRMVISTLQRMYRHFYVRLCDVVDNAKLMDSGVVDYAYLKSMAQSAGLWDGLATYLVIVSEYVESYRGVGIDLPSLVTDAAHFGNELVYFKRNFLRIPIFPQSAKLYASEWKRLLLNGEFANTFRLSLLPGLATAAALEMKFTGSDKGIW